MPKQSETINLLQAKEKNMLENFLYWSLTVGRFVVIFTETIAIIAFLYRFTLDAQIIDLHTSIKRKEAIVEYQKAQEDTYRDVQKRLAISNQLMTESSLFTTIASDSSQIGQAIRKLNNISIGNRSLTIDADVHSISDLGTFVRALKSYKYIQVVSLDKIENKTTLGIINVNITADLK